MTSGRHKPRRSVSGSWRRPGLLLLFPLPVPLFLWTYPLPTASSPFPQPSVLVRSTPRHHHPHIQLARPTAKPHCETVLDPDRVSQKARSTLTQPNRDAYTCPRATNGQGLRVEASARTLVAAAVGPQLAFRLRLARPIYSASGFACALAPRRLCTRATDPYASTARVRGPVHEPNAAARP